MIPPSVDTYQVGVICALPKEMLAARTMFDEEYGTQASRDARDMNSYTLGRIHGHNVVITCLPTGVTGSTSAATAASNMLRTFPAIRFGLMVGIGSGIPGRTCEDDVRLGDVAVSQPSGIHGGVVQYDSVKNLGRGRLQPRGHLQQPPTVLLTALSSIQAQPGTTRRQMADNISRMGDKAAQEDEGYLFPGVDRDQLFCAQCDATHWPLWRWLWWILLFCLSSSWLCHQCKGGKLPRSLDRTDAKLHYGTIASGNVLLRNSVERDRLRDEFGAICVETKAAGLMNDFPCLVIRGICDYADSYRNDTWQKYAALTAASFAKILLGVVKPVVVDGVRTAATVVEISDFCTHNFLNTNSSPPREGIEKNRKHLHASEARCTFEREQLCHQAFKTQGSYEDYKNLNPRRVAGTCRWVLENTQFQAWKQSESEALLWISADPGCGKSVLARSLVDRDLGEANQQGVCYYFFKDNPSQDNVPTALCAILHQLFTYQPSLLHHALPFWDKNHSTIQQEREELWRILLSAATDSSARPIVCILDALDECRDSDQRWLIEKLCELHQSPSKPPQNIKLKFLVTSKPYESVQRWFKHITFRFPQIRIHGEAENDQINKEINLVIDRQVDELSLDFNLSDSSQEALRYRLKAMKHRTYLWLHLAYQEIRASYQMYGIQATVQFDSLPASVEDAYERILGRIHTKHKALARRILLIIIGAQRPLTIGELGLALAAAQAHERGRSHLHTIDQQHLQKQVRDICGLFIFINHSRLFLIHQTAKEFLLTRTTSSESVGQKWRFSCHEKDVKSEMARLCVTYLHLSKDTYQQAPTGYESESSDSIDSPVSESETHKDTDADKRSFYRYCARYWMSYLQDEALREDPILLAKARQLYDTSSIQFRAWFPITWKYNSWNRSLPEAKSQHVVSMSDHVTVSQEILEAPTPESKPRDSNDNTALDYAAGCGRPMVTQRLLTAGANVDGGKNPYSPLFPFASEEGHEKLVKVLIDTGADVNVSTTIGNTALYIAAYLGQKTVLQILTDGGADPNNQA